jgi:hypothetical protein
VNVQALPHSQRKGLIVADAVASSFWSAVEANQFGMTESQYAMQLQPITWRWKGEFSGAGLKVWPKEAIPALQLDGNHRWLRDGFGFKQK